MHCALTNKGKPHFPTSQMVDIIQQPILTSCNLLLDSLFHSPQSAKWIAPFELSTNLTIPVYMQLKEHADVHRTLI